MYLIPALGRQKQVEFMSSEFMANLVNFRSFGQPGLEAGFVCGGV